MNLADDLVFGHHLKFCGVLEQEFVVNAFSFGCNVLFWFHQVR